MKNGKYILVIAPEDYPGKRYRGRYCYEHTLIWWKENGTLPEADECIHHENGDTQDNSAENLTLIKKNEHSRGHQAPARKLIRSCARCGDPFEKVARNIEFKERQGQKDFYCSRSCMGAHFGRGREKH